MRLIWGHIETWLAAWRRIIMPSPLFRSRMIASGDFDDFDSPSVNLYADLNYALAVLFHDDEWIAVDIAISTAA